MNELKQKVEDIQDFLKEYEDYPEVVDELHKICKKVIYSKRLLTDHAAFLNRRCVDCYIDDEINARIHNACHFAGLFTLGDVIRYGKKEMLRLPRIGVKSVEELERFFEKHGIKFE